MNKVKLASELVQLAKELMATVSEKKNWRGQLNGIDIPTKTMRSVLNESATQDVFTLRRHEASLLATLSPEFAKYQKEAMQYAKDHDWKKPEFGGMPAGRNQEDGFKVWLLDKAQT